MDSPSGTPVLLTPAEASKRLRISTRSLWSLVAQGKIKTIRPLPRRIAIDESDLVAYIDSLRDRRAST